MESWSGWVATFSYSIASSQRYAVFEDHLNTDGQGICSKVHTATPAVKQLLATRWSIREPQEKTAAHGSHLTLFA
jgi:hypothetical protein